jgi:hypothetical protein
VKRAPRALALAAFVLAASAVATACGGSSGGSSTNPGSASYDPATSALHKAGLQVCSESQRAMPHGIQTNPQEVAASRGFFVAKDCKGKKTSPDTVLIFQFTSKQAIDSGAPAIKAAFPHGESTTSGPLLIITNGPNAKANMAAIKPYVPKFGTSTTTTG